MKKSEMLKVMLDELRAKDNELLREMVFKHPEYTLSKSDELVKIYYDKYGRDNKERIFQLEEDIRKERNRELKVGDGVTVQLYQNREAYTIIKKTKCTIKIQRDNVTLDPSFKPIWGCGEFTNYCINNTSQRWVYERDPKGVKYVCWWSEKNGCYMLRLGVNKYKLYLGRHESYDFSYYTCKSESGDNRAVEVENVI